MSPMAESDSPVQDAAYVRRRVALAHVVAPLALGGASYVFFARAFDRGIAAARVLGLDHTLRTVRRLTVPMGTRLPDAFRFQLADAAWGWALGAALSTIWAGDGVRSRRNWFAGGALFAAATEVAQFAHLLPGTFDPLDLIVSEAAYVAAWLLVSRVLARGKKQHV